MNATLTPSQLKLWKLCDDISIVRFDAKFSRNKEKTIRDEYKTSELKKAVGIAMSLAVLSIVHTDNVYENAYNVILNASKNI